MNRKHFIHYLSFLFFLLSPFLSLQHDESKIFNARDGKNSVLPSLKRRKTMERKLTGKKESKYLSFFR